MIDPNASDETKLLQARKQFIHDREHHAESHRQMRECAEIVAGNQWDPRAAKIMQDQGRPMNVFNLIHGKVESQVGMYAELASLPFPMPMGHHDQSVSDVAAGILHSGLQDVRWEAIDRSQYRTSLVMGECDTLIHFKRDDRNPTWSAWELLPLDPRMVIWDAASRHPNRTDARHVYVHRFYALDEFRSRWPEHADDAERMLKSEGESDADALGEGGYDDPREDYVDEHFVDRRRMRIRVVQCEYKRREVEEVLVNRATSEVTTIEGAFARDLREAAEAGRVPGNFEVHKRSVDRVYRLDFIGTKVLSSGVSEEPFEGFSVKAGVCYMHANTGSAYGPVAIMKDPQQDVNKSHASTLENLASQGRGGTISEEGAIPNVKTFKQQRQTPMGNAVVAKGALTAGKITVVDGPQLNPALVERLNQAVTMLDLTSGIQPVAETAARGVEAATTVALREHKSVRSLEGAKQNHEAHNVEVARALLEGILNTAPQEQLLHMLSDPNRWAVVEGQLYDIRDPEQPTPVDLDAVRGANYDYELQPSGKGDAERLRTLNVMLQVEQTRPGTVSPEVILDHVGDSRAMRERLKEWLQSQQQAQGQAAQSEQEGQRALMAATVDDMRRKRDIEEAKVAGDVERHRRADALKAETEVGKLLIDVLDIWERADEAEKARIMQEAELIQRQRETMVRGVTT